MMSDKILKHLTKNTKMAQYIIEEKILIPKEYIHTGIYMETQNTFIIQFYKSVSCSMCAI